MRFWSRPRTPKPLPSLGRWLLLSCLTLVSILWLQQPLLAQIPGLNVAAEEAGRTPNIPTFRYGNIDVAPVFIDGEPTYWVASDLGLDAGENAERTPRAAFRAQLIQSKLAKLLNDMSSADAEGGPLADIDDPRQLEQAIREQLKIRIDESLGMPVVVGAFPEDAPEEIIFTVTEADAQFLSEPADRLAAKLKLSLERELLEHWRERRPEELLQRARLAIAILAGTAIASALLAFWQRRLRDRGRQLRQHRKAESATSNFGSEEGNNEIATPLELLTRQLQSFTFERQYTINLVLRRALFWLHLLAWVVSIGIIGSLFYWSRPLSNWILGIYPGRWMLSWGQMGTLGAPLMLVSLFFGLTMADKVTDLFIDRLAKRWLEEQVHAAAVSKRASLRIPTLAAAAKGVTTAIAYAVFIVITLSQFRAITAPVTALVSIVVFGISLGAQNFIRDVINGILILAEDQYAVGDVVAIGGAAGLVENLNLRITQLRSLEGELITIPNGSVGQVCNMSSGWSRAKFAIEIASSEDIDRAIEVLMSVAREMYAEPGWQERVLDEPEILGVDKLDYAGTQLVMLLKTQPLQQWGVAREYRRRVKKAFDVAGIAIGMPRQVTYLENARPASENGNPSGRSTSMPAPATPS